MIFLRGNSQASFEGIGWKNGREAAGCAYGIKIAAEDRNKHFRREWKVVRLLLSGTRNSAVVNIDKGSFWAGSCCELIGVDIGDWMRSHQLLPWAKGRPPRFVLKPIENDLFSVEFVQIEVGD